MELDASSSRKSIVHGLKRRFFKDVAKEIFGRYMMNLVCRFFVNRCTRNM